MAHKFIIDDRTGALYSDFTARRLTSAAELLQAERGLTPTFEIYSINVATDTRAVTGQTLTNGNLSVAIGLAGKAPDKGLIKAAFNVSGSIYESAHLNLENLTADSLASAFNNAVYPVYNAGGLEVDQLGEGKWLLTMKKVGAISGSPSLNVESSDPPSAVEVNSVRTGDSDTKAQWIINLIQSPVANIATGSWSSATSGSYSGLSSTISLNTTAMLSAIARGQRDFEISIIHSGQVLHRSSVSIHESLDPTAAGSIVVTSPTLFTLGSNAVNQGETIAISGGLTYDGTTLAAPFLPLAGGTMTGALNLGDNINAQFGDSQQLKIYHNGANNAFIENSTTYLVLESPNIILRNTAGNEDYAKFLGDGGCEFYFNNSKKFETTDTGATISGKLIVNGDLDVSGSTTQFESTVVSVQDPIFTVGGSSAPESSDNMDRGIEFRYFRSGESAKIGFFGYSNADDAYKLLTSATNSSEVFSGTLADLNVANVQLENSGKIKTWSNHNNYLKFDEWKSQSSSHKIENIAGNIELKASDSSGTIQFETNGTEAARFDSNGNFSIANTATMSSSNAERLIIGNGSDAEGITIFSGNNKGGYLHFADGTIGDQSYRGIIQYSHPLDSFIFRTGGCTESMRLNCTGLGIGGTASKKLHVKDGSSGFSGSYNARTQAIIESDNSTGTALSILNPSSGNGTIYFGDNSEEYSGQIIYTHTGDVMKFATNATVRMSLDSTGLGITEKLYHLDDDNTYLQFNTDQINLATDGNDRLRLESAAVKCGRDLRISQGVGYSNFLVLSHNDSNAFVKNNFGDLYIENTANGKDTIFKNDNDSGTATELLRLDGSASSVKVPDDIKLQIGSSNDLQIYHTTINNQSWIYNSTGNLNVTNNAINSDIVLRCKDATTVNELMRLDGSTGNVGIGGVTSPIANLQIDTPAANNAGQGIRINRPSAGNNYHSLEFSTDGTVDWSVGQNSNNAFEVYENGSSSTTRLTVATGGNVGINDSSPSNILSVSGDSTSQACVAKITRVQASASNDTYTFEVDSSAHTSNMTAGGAFAVDVNAGRAFTINGNGACGIGTDSPDGLLMIQKDQTAATKLIISNGGTANANTSCRLSFYEGASEKNYIERRRDGSGKFAFVTPADDNPFVFENASGEFLRLVNGNVGINETSPASKCTVTGGDFETTTVSKGIVLKSPNGTRYRLHINDDASVAVTAM